MSRWNVSSCDWLNFINLSVSLPWQLEFLITPLYESTVCIFLSCTYVYSTPFKLHGPPFPHNNWTLIMFAEKQPTLLYCINKVLKTLQVLYSLLLTQFYVRFLCIHRHSHNEVCQYRNTTKTLEILLCGPPSSLTKIFLGKHCKIAYKWCRDISRQHEPHTLHPTTWRIKFSNVSSAHNTSRILKTTLVSKSV